MMGGVLALYGMLVLGLARAEMTSHHRWQMILKPLAALGFCLIAYLGGGLLNPFGQLVIFGLIVCAIGDICLLSRQNPWLFKLGMLAFAFGHIIYAYAFLRLGINGRAALFSLLVMGAASLAFYRYLYPHLPADMRIPVVVYVVIITLMVVSAIGSGERILIFAALIFAVSDMFVARDRFIRSGPENALVITPLYFGAQALFALSACLLCRGF